MIDNLLENKTHKGVFIYGFNGLDVTTLIKDKIKEIYHLFVCVTTKLKYKSFLR